MSEHEIIDIILQNRNITDKVVLLNPPTNSLIPYEKLINIDEAFNIFWNGIRENKCFKIHADVDVDGCTSCAIIYRYIKNFTDSVNVSINKGKEHGIKNYDLSQLQNVDILIIVDSINAEEEYYQRIMDLGVQIIVLDHHIVPETLKNVEITLVSSANNYPNPNLSGAGVVWKFCKYIDYMTLNDYADDLVDLASCGIVADMCNLDYDNQENRYICSLGFNNQQNIGIKKINGSYDFNSQAISFGIAPLVNAANRTEQNEKALQLFISDDKKEISNIIKVLKESKEEQNNSIKDLMPIIEEQALKQLGNKVMFFEIDTEANVAGLIGNKLLEKYKRPLFVLKHKIECDDNGEIIKDNYGGSCRAIGVENFKKYVDETNLAITGGHELAFGTEISAEFYEDFQKVINDNMKDIEFVNDIFVDIQISEEQVTDVLINQLKSINKITGEGFKPINVMIDGIKNYSTGSMSNGKHLKIMSNNLTFIKWNFGGDFDELDNSIYDLELSFVGKLDASFFGRQYTRQMIIDDYIIKGGE